MKHNGPSPRDYMFLYALTITMVFVAFLADNNAATAEDDKLDRAQTIIVNLNKEQGCAGWFLLQDIRKAQEMDHDLGKAHFQIEEADHTYARLRNRRDDRYLAALQTKVEKCEADRKQLEEDLHDAFDTLRTSIKEVIMTDPERKKQKKAPADKAKQPADKVKPPA